MQVDEQFDPKRKANKNNWFSACLRMQAGNTDKENRQMKKAKKGKQVKLDSKDGIIALARQKVRNMEGEYVALHKKHDQLTRQAQEVTNRMIARKGAIDEFNKFIEETGRESMTNGKKKPAKKKKTAKKK